MNTSAEVVLSPQRSRALGLIGWNPKVEARSGRGTVYLPAGMSSGPSSQRSRALCLTLGAAVLMVGAATSTASAQWTVVNLHPAGATSSQALGVDGGQQVGNATIGGALHASLWTGTAGSWVDLTPAGSSSSEGRGVSAGQQVGGAPRATRAVTPSCGRGPPPHGWTSTPPG